MGSQAGGSGREAVSDPPERDLEGLGKPAAGSQRRGKRRLRVCAVGRIQSGQGQRGRGQQIVQKGSLELGL